MKSKYEKFSDFTDFVMSWSPVPVIISIILLVIAFIAVALLRDDIVNTDFIWILYFALGSIAITGVWLTVGFICDKTEDFIIKYTSKKKEKKDEKIH